MLNLFHNFQTHLTKNYQKTDKQAEIILNFFPLDYTSLDYEIDKKINYDKTVLIETLKNMIYSDEIEEFINRRYAVEGFTNRRLENIAYLAIELCKHYLQIESRTNEQHFLNEIRNIVNQKKNSEVILTDALESRTFTQELAMYLIMSYFYHNNKEKVKYKNHFKKENTTNTSCSTLNRARFYNNRSKIKKYQLANLDSEKKKNKEPGVGCSSGKENDSETKKNKEPIVLFFMGKENDYDSKVLMLILNSLSPTKNPFILSEKSNEKEISSESKKNLNNYQALKNFLELVNNTSLLKEKDTIQLVYNNYILERLANISFTSNLFEKSKEALSDIPEIMLYLVNFPLLKTRNKIVDEYFCLTNAKTIYPVEVFDEYVKLVVCHYLGVAIPLLEFVFSFLITIAKEDKNQNFSTQFNEYKKFYFEKLVEQENIPKKIIVSEKMRTESYSNLYLKCLKRRYYYAKKKVEDNHELVEALSRIFESRMEITRDSLFSAADKFFSEYSLIGLYSKFENNEFI